MKTNRCILDLTLTRKVVLVLAMFAATLFPRGAAGAPVTVATNWPVGIAIPDGNPLGLTNTQVFSAPFTTIGSLKVSLNITGGFNGDLSVALRHESGHQGRVSSMKSSHQQHRTPMQSV